MVAKRPASASAKAVAKRSKTDPVGDKCKAVAAAVQEFEGLSESLRRMLVSAVAPALSQYKDARHEHQQVVIGWLQEACAAQQASLAQVATDASAKVESCGSEKGTCEGAISSAEEALIKLSDATAEAEVKANDAEAAVLAAEGTLTDAKEAEAGVAVAADAAAAQKETLQAVLAEDGVYAKMKSEMAKKKDCDAFMRTLKKNKFDQTLVQTLGPVLVKDPSARTEFDALVMAQFEQAVAELVAAQVKIIDDASTAKAEKATAKEAADAALEVARAANAAAQEVLKQAKDAEAAGNATVKDAKKALKACGPSGKAAEKAAKDAAAALEDFKSGPLAVFEELRDRSTPVEPPAEEPPAEEAPAAETAGQASAEAA